MRKKILYLTTLSFFLLLLVSCDKENQSVKEYSLMPVNTGNTWTYKYTNFRNDVVNLDTSVLKVGEKITINGYTCFALVSEMPFNSKFLIGNDEDGNYVTYGGFSDVDTMVTPTIRFKIDAKFGDEWESKTTIMHLDSGNFSFVTIPVKCISEDTLISTPKGKFHCKAFEGSNKSINVIYRDYLSVNIGRVKSEFFIDDQLHSFEELLEYHLIK